MYKKNNYYKITKLNILQFIISLVHFNKKIKKTLIHCNFGTFFDKK